MSKKILVITIIPAAFFLSGCQPLNITTPSDSETPEQTLKTYENKRYGFSLQYPSSWNEYEDEGGYSVTISPQSEKFLRKNPGGAFLEITGIYGRVLSGEEEQVRRKLADSWNRLIEDNNKDVGIELTEDEITIDGIKTIRTKAKNIKIEAIESSNYDDYVIGNGTMYYFVYNGQKLKMIYLYPVDEENKYKDLFEQIVSSIKFK